MVIKLVKVKVGLLPYFVKYYFRSFAIMSINKEIGNRLRDIADENGGPSAFAKMLGITPQLLNDYLSGRRIPGNKMQDRLRTLKVDLAWLITGQKEKELKQNANVRIEKLIAKGLAKEDYEMLDILHGFQIKNRFDLEEFLDWVKLKPHLIKVAEELARHERTKK